MTGSELIFELRKFFGEGWRLEGKEQFKPLFEQLHASPETPVEFRRDSGREQIVVTYHSEDNSYSVVYRL